MKKQLSDKVVFVLEYVANNPDCLLKHIYSVDIITFTISILWTWIKEGGYYFNKK